MARTAERYLDLRPDKEREETVCRAGNYLRLSVDSDYTGSDSLERGDWLRSIQTGHRIFRL